MIVRFSCWERGERERGAPPAVSSPANTPHVKSRPFKAQSPPPRPLLFFRFLEFYFSLFSFSSFLFILAGLIEFLSWLVARTKHCSEHHYMTVFSLKYSNRKLFFFLLLRKECRNNLAIHVIHACFFTHLVYGEIRFVDVRLLSETKQRQSKRYKVKVIVSRKGIWTIGWEVGNSTCDEGEDWGGGWVLGTWL